MLIENKFDVKRFSKSLIDDFSILYNEVFTKGIPLSKKKILMQYGDSEYYLGFIAYDQYKPIGFYGVVPFDFMYDGKIIKIAQSINTMVHPLYRKHNLFFHLAQMTYELAKKENIIFIYGWPNSPKLFGSLLKWINLGPMQSYYFHVKTFPLAKIVWKLSFFKILYNKYLKIITTNAHNKNYESVNFKKAFDNNYFIPRTLNYLNYKKNFGAFILKIEGKNIWVSIDYRLKVGDIEDATLQEFKQILKKLKKIAFWIGINEILFSVDKVSGWNNILKDKYQSKFDTPLMYYPLYESFRLEFAHLTSGDFDTF